MTSYYFDTSALVKIYITEPGSLWTRRVFNTQPLPQIALSKVGIVEAAAAIARRERMLEITTEKRIELFTRFMHDSKNRLRLLGLTDSAVRLGAQLTQRNALRGYDAVHLATALILNHQLVAAGLSALIFVSGDDALCKTALIEGLLSENPSKYES